MCHYQTFSIMSQSLPNPEFVSILVKKWIFSKGHPYAYSFFILVSQCFSIVLASFKSKIGNVFCPAIFLQFRMVCPLTLFCCTTYPKLYSLFFLASYQSLDCHNTFLQINSHYFKALSHMYVPINNLKSISITSNGLGFYTLQIFTTRLQSFTVFNCSAIDFTIPLLICT